MHNKNKIILDANILIRGILGVKVPDIIKRYQSNTLFYTADQCFIEARKHLPNILIKRQQIIQPEEALHYLDLLQRVVEPIDKQFYSYFQEEAQQRIASQDINDWPLVALSMALDCPVWTEDKDFFGTGIATWRTSTIEIYLAGNTSQTLQ